MLFKRKKKNDNNRVLLQGGVSTNVDYTDRAEILYNHKDNPVVEHKEPEEENIIDVNFAVPNQNINSQKKYVKNSRVQTINKTEPSRQTAGNSSPLVKKRKFGDAPSPINDFYMLETALVQAKPPQPFSFPNAVGKFINKRIFECSNDIMEAHLNNLGRVGARILAGYEADQNLQMAAAEHYVDTPYARANTVYNSVEEVPFFLRSFVKDKIKKQLGSEYVNAIKGVFIDNNTDTAKRLAENEDIYLFIKRNKEFLKGYGSIKKDSIQFTDNNFHNAIGKADIVDMYLTKDNEIVFYIVDTYDFNKYSQNPFVHAGRRNQELGRLIPYFIIYSVKIDKNRAERYLR